MEKLEAKSNTFLLLKSLVLLRQGLLDLSFWGMKKKKKAYSGELTQLAGLVKLSNIPLYGHLKSIPKYSMCNGVEVRRIMACRSNLETRK